LSKNHNTEIKIAKIRSGNCFDEKRGIEREKAAPAGTGGACERCRRWSRGCAPPPIPQDTPEKRGTSPAPG